MCALERSTVELPEPPPQIDIPPETSREPGTPSKTITRFWAAAGVVVACCILVLVFYKSHKPAADSLPTATVERTQFARILRLKGTTEAVQSRTFTAPILAGAQLSTLVITHVATAGNKVKRGDLLVEFDRQVQIKDALDKQADYQKFASQVAENQAQEDAAKAKDETELKQAEDELKKDDLEMRRNEVLSRIDAEKNQENLDQAKANLLQLRQTFDLKRRSARAGIGILELQRDRAREDMLHSQGNAAQMQILAPLDGVVVLHTVWKQGSMGEVKEGDQVRPGIALMDVVNPSLMQVRVQANQQDIADLRIGQAAQVRLDAYPEIFFPSKLEELAPLGVPGSFSEKLHSFVAIFSIQGNNPKLMPDLSAAVDVQLEQRDDVLVAPRQSVVTDGREEDVWVKTRMGFHKQAVTAGPQNDTQVVIQSGLSAGDVVKRNPLASRTEPD
jgi:HlyD family secretion protein